MGTSAHAKPSADDFERSFARHAGRDVRYEANGEARQWTIDDATRRIETSEWEWLGRTFVRCVPNESGVRDLSRGPGVFVPRVRREHSRGERDVQEASEIFVREHQSRARGDGRG